MYKYSYIILTAFLIAVITMLILFPKQVVDDFYILCRYADNFKNTGELVWNRGELVEGYTGILLLKILIISPLSYVVTAYRISIVSFLVGGVVIYYLIKDGSIKYFVLFCYLFSPMVYVHIFSGLETVLFSSLTLCSYYFWKTNKKYLFLCSIILMSLCRPEGILLAVLLFKKDYLKIYLWYSVFILLYAVAKTYYYGDLLPNSFYRKSLNSDLFQINWSDFKNYFVLYMGIPLIWAGAILSIKKRLVKPEWRLVVFVVVLTVYYLHANLEMNFSHRFFYHTYPLFLITIGLFLDGVIKIKSTRKLRMR